MASLLNPISRILYRSARASRDAAAVERAVRTGSPMPIVRRVGRKAAGRIVGPWLNRLFR